MAALQAAHSGLWIAAGELSPARRRLARFGTFATVAAVAYAATPKPSEELVVGQQPFLASEGSPESGSEEPFDKRKALVTAGMIGLSAAMIVGRRSLEKKWLARLARKGHTRPRRALAVRMAAVEFTGLLAIQAAEMRTER